MVMPEPFTQQRAVLVHLAEVDSTTAATAARATRMSVHEARAALNGLAARGYAFERLGQESSLAYIIEREVPRGVYVITPDGRWWAGRPWPRRGERLVKDA